MNLLECCHVLAESNISGSVSQRCGDCFLFTMGSNFETQSQSDILTYRLDSLAPVHHDYHLPAIGRFHSNFLKENEDKNICLLFHGKVVLAVSLTELCDRVCSKVKL